jgi:antirestriction protein
MKLNEKVFKFEVEISGEDFALEVKNEIDKLKHLKDVKEYYLDYRGWRFNDSLEELLIDFIIDLKMD